MDNSCFCDAFSTWITSLLSLLTSLSALAGCTVCLYVTFVLLPLKGVTWHPKRACLGRLPCSFSPAPFHQSFSCFTSLLLFNTQSCNWKSNLLLFFRWILWSQRTQESAQSPTLSDNLTSFTNTNPSRSSPSGRLHAVEAVYLWQTNRCRSSRRGSPPVRLHSAARAADSVCDKPRKPGPRYERCAWLDSGKSKKTKREAPLNTVWITLTLPSSSSPCHFLVSLLYSILLKHWKSHIHFHKSWNINDALPLWNL